MAQEGLFDRRVSILGLFGPPGQALKEALLGSPGPPQNVSFLEATFFEGGSHFTDVYAFWNHFAARS